MNIRILTTTAAGFALGAAALPSVALAKGASVTGSETDYPTGVVTIAHDTGNDKPKVEGWQTGEGEVSDQTCQNFADRIGEELDAAGEDYESGDFQGMDGHFSNADAWESMATDYGCAIKYPA